jgi:hypothetical protein
MHGGFLIFLLRKMRAEIEMDQWYSKEKRRKVAYSW